MRRAILASLLLLSLLPVAALADEPKPRVAVLYFDYDLEDEYAQLRKGLAQMLITDLSSTDRLDVVERVRLQDAMAELDLQQSKRIDQATAVKVGKVLGAQYLVIGGYLLLNKQLLINSRIIEVERVVTWGKKVRGPAEEFYDLEQDLAGQLHDEILKRATEARTKTLDEKKKATEKTPTKSQGELGPPKAPKPKLTAAVASQYGRALDAMDRKDNEQAKKHLEAVLTAQPNFALAQADLAMLAR